MSDAVKIEELEAKYKILKNPDNEMYEKMTAACKAKNFYCPCELEQTPDTRCQCKAFKLQDEEGLCHCKRFIKVLR